ncbi:Ig-like domain-containing protein [Idiomarina sp.]|uniref:Ig-like domain-containing protein n=1 Tax=Idiomarina sp. TaxID=1874361 RepID=UPI003A90E35F
MQFKPTLFARSFLALGVAASLTACGSDSDGVNDAPVAGEVAVQWDIAQEPEAIDLLASASDPDGDTLNVSSIGEAEHGTITLEGNTAVYEPNSGYLGEDSFTFTVSDGELTSEGLVKVDVVGTLSVQGRVIDSPIANATVYIVVDGIEYTVQADDDGFYELPATFGSLKGDQVIRITARGSEANGQGNVTLSSMLTSVERLMERAGDDFTLNRSEMNDVNVTHVTTARDILTRKAAGDEEVTADNMAEFGNSIDPQLLIQMAAVTKLIVDNSDFDLPEGYETIEDFLNDDESYNSFVETASQGGDSSPLNQAIEETLNDPEIMPALSIEDLYGRYIEVNRAPAFLKPDAYETWNINEDGLAWVNQTDENIQRVTFSVNGNKLIPDNTDTSLSESVYYSPVDFTDRQDVKDAWIAYNGWSGLQSSQAERKHSTQIVDAKVVSQGDSELVLRYTQLVRSHPMTFEHEGKKYNLFPNETAKTQHDARLVTVDTFKKSNLTFDFNEQPQWILPHVIPRTMSLSMAAYEFSADNTYTMMQADMYLEDPLNYYDSSEAYNQADTSGTWKLSEDAKQLTLTSGSGDYSVRFTRHRNDPDYKSVLAEYQKNGESRLTQLLYGMPVPEQVDFSPFETVTSSDMLFNSIVNYRAAVYWDKNDLLRIQSFMFDFAEDGTGDQLSGLCQGDMFLEFGTICPEPMTVPEQTPTMSWEYGQTPEFENVFIFNRRATDDSLDRVRHWLPLEFSDKKILSVFEWDITTYFTETGEVEGIQRIMPRFNHYQLAERPKSEVVQGQASQVEKASAAKSLESNNLGYTIVNPQTAPTSTSKH